MIELSVILDQATLFLDRQTIPFDDAGSAVAGASVLVTGAAGSVGSAITQRLLQAGAKTIVAVDSSETALIRLERTIQPVAARQTPRQTPGQTPRQTISGIHYVLTDVLDSDHLASVLEKYSVDLVYHAAAYKHLPLVQKNVPAAIRNNVFTTWSVIQACVSRNTRSLIFVSSDKAVKPASVLGCTKRLGEILVAREADRKHWGSIRFGNVFGSSGSVVQVFLDRLNAGKKLMLSHSRAERYFILDSEVAGLAVLAAASELAGDVLVCDTGPPLGIAELAKRMIEYAGTPAGNDDPLEVTGCTEGEKISEELYDPDNTVATSQPNIMRESVDVGRLCDGGDVSRLVDACRIQDTDAIAGIITDIKCEI